MEITMDLLQMEQIMALSAYAKTTADLMDKKKKNRDSADFIRTTEAHLRHSSWTSLLLTDFFL
jgi:hypothetical protein